MDTLATPYRLLRSFFDRVARSSSSPCLPAAALMLALGVLFAAAPEARAQVSGVSYTLSPVGKYAFFENDDASGLENGFLYGGELGFGFGRYLEVSALYLQGDNFGTNLDANSDFDVLPDLDREVDLQQYGARTRVNLGTYGGEGGGFAPFIAGGAGILRFDPEDVDASESIYVTGGLGLTFSALNRYTLTVEGQGMAYRYNPATTFFNAPELEGTTTGQEEVLSPAVRAALQLYLGGRNPNEITDLDRAFQSQFSNGLGGVRFFVEPFYGRIEFADELVGGEGGQFYRDQNVAGVNAGIELGPYVGLRGFYWRGASGQEGVFDEFAEEFQPIAFYGGELNLRFGTSFGQRSFTPYGIIGGGYADVLSDYDDEIEPTGPGTPEDRYFGTLGGGLEVPLSDALKLQGDVRSLFMSSQDVEDLSNPDEVYANLMYSAGLEFNFGGGSAPTAEEILEARANERQRVVREEQRADLDASETRLLEEIRRLETRVDSLEQVEQRRAAEERDARADSMRRRGRRRGAERPPRRRFEEEGPRRYSSQPDEEEDQQPRPQGRDASASNLSGRTIALPIPEVGEIYVRIGEQASSGSGEASVETSYAPPVVMPQSGAVPSYPQQQGSPQQQRAVAGSTLSEQDIANIVREEVRRSSEEADLSRDQIAEIVEQTVRQELSGQAAGGGAAVNDAQIRRLEDQINRLRDDLNDELQDYEDRQRYRQGGQPSSVTIEESSDGDGDGDGETRVSTISNSAYAPTRITPMAGFSFGGAGRFLLGVRGDYGGETGTLGSSAGFRFMPEFALGVGDGVGINLIANGVYNLDTSVISRYLPTNDLSPYVGAGVGLTTETGLGVNLLAGAEYQTSQGAIFVDYSTMDFFDYNRVLIGFRTDF